MEISTNNAVIIAALTGITSRWMQLSVRGNFASAKFPDHMADIVGGAILDASPNRNTGLSNLKSIGLKLKDHGAMTISYNDVRNGHLSY